MIFVLISCVQIKFGSCQLIENKATIESKTNQNYL